ncbi:unnamed protein product [Protopolystoma xenopodis]|uniref:Uncharacterized protein n=1 Tax=Protopolystoma xenopodis TaxID=117903 RepID=A0A448WHQ4_9PLAT|nr:unnamed protein product [Protopolystoma xenopodis]
MKSHALLEKRLLVCGLESVFYSSLVINALPLRWEFAFTRVGQSSPLCRHSYAVFFQTFAGTPLPSCPEPMQTGQKVEGSVESAGRRIFVWPMREQLPRPGSGQPTCLNQYEARVPGHSGPELIRPSCTQPAERLCPREAGRKAKGRY